MSSSQRQLTRASLATKCIKIMGCLNNLINLIRKTEQKTRWHKCSQEINSPVTPFTQADINAGKVGHYLFNGFVQIAGVQAFRNVLQEAVLYRQTN